jgi:hypothetical protein
MVPVPQELEEQVRHYMAWRLTTIDMAGWTEESFALLYEQLDEASRVAVVTIARGVLEDKPVTVGEVAARVGTTSREILGIVVELAQRLRMLGGPAIPLVVFDPPEGKAGDQRPITMPGDGARVVVSIADRT